MSKWKPGRRSHLMGLSPELSCLPQLRWLVVSLCVCVCVRVKISWREILKYRSPSFPHSFRANALHMPIYSLYSYCASTPPPSLSSLSLSVLIPLLVRTLSICFNALQIGARTCLQKPKSFSKNKYNRSYT